MLVPMYKDTERERKRGILQNRERRAYCKTERDVERQKERRIKVSS